MPSKLTLASAIRKIVDNFDKYPENARHALSLDGKTGHRPDGTYGHLKVSDVAVWCASEDTDGGYGIDEELIGVRRDGSLMWAYASGCSCWDGDHEVKVIGGPAELKTFTLNHDHLPAEWEEAIIKFAETGELQALT